MKYDKNMLQKSTDILLFEPKKLNKNMKRYN